MTNVVPKGLKVAFINARSLNGEKLYELKVHFSNFDVIGVCETWFDETQSDGEHSWLEMVFHRHDRVSRCGGVAFYIKKEYACFASVVDIGMAMNPDIELLTIKVSRPDCRKISYTCVYRPPSGKFSLFLTKWTATVAVDRGRH